MRDDRWQRLRALQAVHEAPFHSHLPILGPVIVWFRTLWNDVATRWYVRPLVEQQNSFNQAVIDALAAQEAANEAALQEISARLIEQDREQTQLVREIGELTTQVTRQRRLLAALPCTLAPDRATLPDDQASGA